MIHPKLSAFLVFLLPLSLFGQAASDADWKVRVDKVKVGKDLYLYASNEHPYAPQNVRVKFLEMDNVSFSGTQPIRAVLPPQGTVTLGRLSRLDPKTQVRIKFNATYGLGDPESVPDKDFPYLFPYAHGVKHGMFQGYFGNATHQSCHCLDFDLEEGSPVHAARDGLVARVWQGFSTGGPSPAFRDKSNGVWILHSDGTVAQYAHLQKDGARVRPGQEVTAGQMIGLSGHTGQASGPHLHFQVNQPSWGEDKTVPTLFLGQDGSLISPEQGKFYYSYHPSGEPFREVKADNFTEEQLDRTEANTRLNGSVTVLTRTLDGQVLFYGSNGTEKGITLTVTFTELENFTGSKPLPFTKAIPSGKSVYLFSLKRGYKLRDDKYNFGYKYRYKWR